MSEALPTPAQRAQLEERCAARIIDLVRVTRGHSQAGRWLASLSNGASMFLKVGVDDVTRDGLALEARTYRMLSPVFTPKLLAFVDQDDGCLALEDLSAAAWPPPWSDGQVDVAFEVLGRIPSEPQGDGCGLGRLVDRRSHYLGWGRVASEPTRFHALGVRDERWLDEQLETLLDLEHAAQLDGPDLVHRDLRSDNVCFVGSECKVIDWAGTEIGNWRFDAVSLMISITADEPGINVRRYLEAGDTELLALQAGFLASRAGRPDPYPGSPVRSMQRTQLAGALALLDQVL